MVSLQPRTHVPVARSLPGPTAYMCGLTWAEGYLWHSDQDAGKIFAIDPRTGSVARVIACSMVRADLAYHDGLLCQVGGRPKRVLLINMVTGSIVEQKQVAPPSGRLCGIEMGPEGMWMCLRNPAVVQLRDFETMTVRRELPAAGAPSGLTYANGMVVYSEFDTGIIRVVDTDNGKILGSAAVEGRPTGVTWDGHQLWYCDFDARRIKSVRLDHVLQAG